MAIGIGVNLVAPRQNSSAASLNVGTTRNDVLLQIIPAIRAVAGYRDILTAQEQRAWTQRDLATDRAVSAPVAGVVRGLERNGALRVEDASGVVHELRTGSLVFAPNDAVGTSR